MNNQELYHNYLRWAQGALPEREAQSTWRWVKEYLEKKPSAERAACLEDVIGRLDSGEPIQYITEKAYFFDLELKVNDSVLIPRPETEELVFHVSNIMKDLEGPVSVLDIGTGSGCIALAVKRQHPEAMVMACDVDPKALQVAKENFVKYGEDIPVFEGDFTRSADFADLPDIDIIVCNPPYILESERKVMSYSTRYEPDIALFSKEGPMWAYESLIQLGLQKLKPGGIMAMEMNEFHAQAITDLATELGMGSVRTIEDLQGKPRVLICRRMG